MSPAPANRTGADPQRVRAKKTLGQHFLTDANILRRIARAAQIEAGDLVLEIGPGLGHLTRALLQAGARVVAVEIDRQLAARLKTEFGADPRLSILEGDILDAPPDEWLRRGGQEIPAAGYKVVANLPYYVTSAILRRLLETERQPSLILVLVQREVAQQITAAPGAMSLLALSVQFYGVPAKVGVVPAGAFNPRPQVDSAIVRIAVSHPSRFPRVNPELFFELARAGFSVRRKQIHNALEQGLHLDAAEIRARLVKANIDPRRRAETLSLEEWERLYEQFASRGPSL